MRANFCTSGFFLLAVLGSGVVIGQEQSAPPNVKEAELGATPNVHTCGGLFLGGQPGAEDLQQLKRQGIQRVVTLREDGETEWDEQVALEGVGIEFVQVPFRSSDSLTDEVFETVRRLLKEAEQKPTLLHCGSANRVGAVWLTYRVLDQGIDVEQAVAEAKTVGLRNEAYEEKARDYVKRKQEQR